MSVVVTLLLAISLVGVSGCAEAVYRYSSSSSCVLRAPVFLSVRPFIPPSVPVANKQRSSIPAVPPCQSICIVACCSHCCGGQSLALSGITQLDGGHGQGHLGPLGRTKTANLTGPGPGHDSRAGNSVFVCVSVCVCVCVSAGNRLNPKFTGHAH